MKRLISVFMTILILILAPVAYSDDSLLPDGAYSSENKSEPFYFGKFTIAGNRVIYMGPSRSSGRGVVSTESRYEISGREMKLIAGDGKVENVFTFEKKSENLYVIGGSQFIRATN